ncbi:hypothetical protein CCACVL1_00074, partial [Corchorus capsularis]
LVVELLGLRFNFQSPCAAAVAQVGDCNVETSVPQEDEIVHVVPIACASVPGRKRSFGSAQQRGAITSKHPSPPLHGQQLTVPVPYSGRANERTAGASGRFNRKSNLLLQSNPLNFVYHGKLYARKARFIENQLFHPKRITQLAVKLDI